MSKVKIIYLVEEICFAIKSILTKKSMFNEIIVQIKNFSGKNSGKNFDNKLIKRFLGTKAFSSTLLA